MSMIVDSILEANLPYVLVALREVHLYKHWLSGIVLDACYLAPRPGKIGGACWVQFASPVPFVIENRDVCVKVEVFDYLSSITPHVTIVLTDHQKPAFSLGPAVSSVQMHVQQIVIRVLKLRQNATRLTVHGTLVSGAVDLCCVFLEGGCAV